ncbi:MAG: phospholipase A, partial [Thermoanaerobaculia bacterium]
MSANPLILAKPLRCFPLLLLSCLAPFSVSPAEAQNATTISPEACTGLDADAERLACYDRAVDRDRRPGSAAETSPAADPEPSPPPDAATLSGAPPAELMARPEVAPAEGAPSPVEHSILDGRWELTRKAKLGTFGLRAYKPLYVLPGVYTDEPNQFPSSPVPGHSVDISESQDNFEAKFQLSFKTKVAQEIFGPRGDLWFGYTQSSRWQVYSSADSRPFRETNYEPELMLVFGTRYHLLGLDGRLLGVSLNHQSNGKDLPYSRSWNRIIGLVGLERQAWTILIRPWWRLPEVAGGEDNPDIEDFVGRGDILVVRRLRD